MTILYKGKNVSNFNFVFVGKIKLNFYYKMMTEKIYDNFQEKYKNSVFQILKICKASSNFDFNSTVRNKIHGLCDCLEISSQKCFRQLVKLNIKINSSTYSFSI